MYHDLFLGLELPSEPQFWHKTDPHLLQDTTEIATKTICAYTTTWESEAEMRKSTDSWGCGLH
jgi:hypothetical protein